MMGGGNPLTDIQGGNAVEELQIESIAGAHIIKPSAFRDIMDVLQAMSDNKARINYLEKAKRGFLFNSKQLNDFVVITESLKTRIAFIESICPRLTDPQANPAKFVDMFRFEDERAKVEAAFKSRLETLKASSFNAGGAGALSSGGRGGGAGRGGAGRGGAGRGGAGRGGAGRGTSTATPITRKIPVAAAAAAALLNADSDSDDKESEKSLTSSSSTAKDISIQPPSQTHTSVVPTVAAIKPKSAITPISAKNAIKPVNAIKPASAEDRRNSSSNLKRVSISMGISTSCSVVLSYADEKARLEKEEKEAASEVVEEISESERKVRAEIKLVLAALGLNINDVTDVDGTRLERWEEGLVEASEKRSRASKMPFSSAAAPVVSTMNSNLLPWEVEEKQERVELEKETETERKTTPLIVTPPKQLPAKSSSLDSSYVPVPMSSTAKSTPILSSTTTPTPTPRKDGNAGGRRFSDASGTSSTLLASGALAEELPDPGILNAMKAKFERGSIDTAQVTPAKQSSDRGSIGTSARSMFSPTRVSYSPAGEKTPPPTRLAESVNIDKYPHNDIKHFEQGAEIKGVMYTFTQMEQAAKYAFALNIDRVSFITSEESLPVSKNSLGEDMFSYFELLRKQFFKSYGSIDHRKMEYYLDEKEFENVFNISKVEWYNLPEWKKKQQKQSLLLF